MLNFPTEPVDGDVFTFETQNLQKGIFDDAIDCTYVIHLLQNGRLEHIYNEIRRTIPTKTVIIAKNLGYKKCNKKLIDNAPYQDLTDAFLQCFSHAKQNGYYGRALLGHPSKKAQEHYASNYLIPYINKTYFS